MATADLDMNEELFQTTIDGIRRVTGPTPTSEELMSAVATVIQAGAAVWLSYQQGKGAAKYMPLDEKRFVMLAQQMHAAATEARRPARGAS